MQSFDIQERVQTAINNFESGYNCSQSVLLAYADLLDLDIGVANKLSVPFGGGLGRMRKVCGAVSSMSMIAGLYFPVSTADDMEIRTKVYSAVQQMSDLFKQRYGSIICGKLLNQEEAVKTVPMPSIRTKEYYMRRPCSKYVAEAAYIAGQLLQNKLGDNSQEIKRI